MALTWDATTSGQRGPPTTCTPSPGTAPPDRDAGSLTMFTSIGSEIDAENIEELIRRVPLHERLFGPMRRYDVDTDYRSPEALTEEQIRRTSACGPTCRNETRETWLSRLTEQEFFQTVPDPDQVSRSAGSPRPASCWSERRLRRPRPEGVQVALVPTVTRTGSDPLHCPYSPCLGRYWA